jgi:hypothetical protein
LTLCSKTGGEKHRVAEHTEVKQKAVGWVRGEVNISPIEKLN